MISTTGEYALRAAVFLTQRYPEPQTCAQIGEGTYVPASYLSKLLQFMVRSHLVQSQRGLHGGFSLTRDPQDISVLDVLDSVDAAPQRITQCPLGLKGHVSLCPVHRLVDESVAQARLAFASANLLEISSSAHGSVPLCDHRPELSSQAI